MQIFYCTRNTNLEVSRITPTNPNGNEGTGTCAQLLTPVFVVGCNSRIRHTEFQNAINALQHNVPSSQARETPLTPQGCGISYGEGERNFSSFQAPIERLKPSNFLTSARFLPQRLVVGSWYMTPEHRGGYCTCAEHSSRCP